MDGRMTNHSGRKNIMRKSATQVMPGDVVEEHGRYRGIVHSVEHHDMSVTVEMFDGSRIHLSPGQSVCVRV